MKKRWPIIRQFYWRLRIFLTLFLFVTLETSQAATLQQQLEQAVVSFRNGEYEAAYWQLESLELDFGSEPEFLNPEFQQTILPVRGYAALMADRPTDALVFFGALLQNHKTGSRLRAFTLYNAAIAQAQANAPAAAAKTYAHFQDVYPGAKEAGLALLQEAELLHGMGESEAAAQKLDNFYNSEASFTLRMQARLRALQIAGETNATQRVRDILFATEWKIDSMPNIAVLSFAALDAGDLLLREGRHLDAIRAYRLILPRDKLIEKQRQRLRETERSLEQHARFGSSIWKSHARQLTARMRGQLNLLESMQDYTPALYVRSGQAYLLAERYREAVLLFREVASDVAFEDELRAEAHYRWILSLHEMKRWTEARSAAKGFLEEHPKHELANDALFLIARAYQDEGLYSKAIEVLDGLVGEFPDDPQVVRWYFTRGYNHSLLEDQVSARESFEAAINGFPENRLIPRVELWRALTFFFERDYPESLRLMEDLEARTKEHPVYPEILYRLANVHYAERNYAKTLEITAELTETFPEHHRVAEARALRGDSYMGLGELTTAAHAFRQVTPENGRLFDYATFQTAKIYRALERYDLLREHLRSYIEREDAAERTRISEALYWIGWSLRKEDRTEEAFPVFNDALERFGNDPAARSVHSILAAYEELYKKRHPDGNGGAPEFQTWLRNAATKSLAQDKLTWFSRLKHFTAERQRSANDEAVADASLLAIHRMVPLDRQDPETLAAVGQVLAERGYTLADDYFEAILTDYPKRSARAAAYYGKARLAAEAGRVLVAKRWLTRFLEETPNHALAPEAHLLGADMLTRQGLHDDARETLNDILGTKNMRGRPHARALGALARIETELDRPERAIAYWQRIYTLYPAYPKETAEAYWESSLLFEAIGKPEAARNTLEEMLADKRLKDFYEYERAQEKLLALQENEQVNAEATSPEPLPEQVDP
ncbi:MAG: tetratricopeptide repeat protein [Opitutales bacterium]